MQTRKKNPLIPFIPLIPALITLLPELEGTAGTLPSAETSGLPRLYTLISGYSGTSLFEDAWNAVILSFFAGDLCKKLGSWWDGIHWRFHISVATFCHLFLLLVPFSDADRLCSGLDSSHFQWCLHHANSTARMYRRGDPPVMDYWLSHVFFTELFQSCESRDDFLGV